MKTEKLSDRLRKYRTNKNLTIESTAKKLGVAVSTYREWELGRAIRGEPYLKMRDLFEVSLEELLTGSKPDNLRIVKEVSLIEEHIKNIRIELNKYS